MNKDTLPSLSALRQFVEVQNCGSIASAARKLGLSQPALSKNLKRFEANIGTPLFDRHSRGIELTQAGRAFFKHASVVLVELDHGLNEARKASGAEQNELKIGAGTVFAESIIPNVVAGLERELPNLVVSVQSIPFETIEDHLIDRKVDICAHAIPEISSAGIVSRSIHRARRGIICSKNHPLANLGRPVSLNEIAKYSFVAFAPERNQMQHVDRVFLENLLHPPKISLVSDTASGALNAMRKSEHLMFGSFLLATFDPDSQLVPLNCDFDFGQYNLGFTYRSDIELESGTKRFMSFAKQILETGHS